MASKKLKKALMAGLAGAALTGISRAAQNKEFLATEGGDKSVVKKNYITKKVKQDLPMKKPTENTKKGFLKREVFTTKPETTVRDAVAKVKDTAKKVMSMGPGPNATSKKGGTLAGDYRNAFGDGYSGGAKAGKMIKARGGKMVNLKPTKLY